MECWNIDFQKDISHFNFIVNSAGGGTINPALHYPLRAVGPYEPEARTHYSHIPAFQHSSSYPVCFRFDGHDRLLCGRIFWGDPWQERRH
jgi:hypothetical protein